MKGEGNAPINPAVFPVWQTHHANFLALPRMRGERGVNVNKSPIPVVKKVEAMCAWGEPLGVIMQT